MVFYEGDDRQCAICTEDFVHGDRVCRLRCRHMFHASCWDRLISAANRPASVHPSRGDCPNCRGAGAMIAVWNYLSPDLITQDVPGLGRARNELDSYASHHNIGTPRSTLTDIEAPHMAPFYDDDAFIGISSATERPSDEHTEAETIARLTSYHIRTRLADGRPALVVDPGSVGNLCGDVWAKTVAVAAKHNGQEPSYTKRQRPLDVSGVGKGAQTCQYDCQLPVALRKKDGGAVTLGKITTPTVSHSDLPGLLGLTALTKNRAIIDFQSLEMHFLGPGDYNLESMLPPGTDTYKLEVAPSGHLVLPCCEYSEASTADQHTLTLMAATTAASTSAASSSTPAPRVVPPPPAYPPRVPPAETIVSPPPGLSQQ